MKRLSLLPVLQVVKYAEEFCKEGSGYIMSNDKKKPSDNNYEEHYTKYDGLWGETLSQLKNRLVFSRRSKDMICIYCGESAQTREHCPPRSFFPEHDFPNNLRVLPACKKCNKGFSHAEEIVRDYLDCIYDCFSNNKSADDYPEKIRRYADFTEQSKTLIEEAEIVFSKVAQGLAIYEMSECFGDFGWSSEITDFICKHWVTPDEWDHLDDPIPIDVFPELGTRASGGFFIAPLLIVDGVVSTESLSTMWTELKEDVFNYVVWLEDDIIKVRMILRDFFYVEVDFYNEGVYEDD